MSNKKNYRKMYSAEDEQVATTEETVEAPVTTEEQPPVPKKTSKKIKGAVDNCTKLNVREHPSMDSDVLCVLPVSSEVQVVVDEQYDEWYHVFTETGIEGFCMKKYIAVKR